MGYDANSLALLGGLVAALVAGKLLLNRYPNTWLIVLHCLAFWRYVGYYALFGFLATWVMLHTPWGRLPAISIFPSYIFWPLAVGLVSPFAKLTLVGSMPGADQFHFTIRAVLILFEPGLLTEIRNEEYARVKVFVSGYADRWRDLGAVVLISRQNLPDTLTDEERLIVEHGLAVKKTPLEVMMAYLRFAGRRNFLLAFATEVEKVEEHEPQPVQESQAVNKPPMEARPVVSRRPPRAMNRESVPDALPRKSPVETQHVG